MNLSKKEKKKYYTTPIIFILNPLLIDYINFNELL